jgi:hypothetical protein
MLRPCRSGIRSHVRRAFSMPIVSQPRWYKKSVRPRTLKQSAVKHRSDIRPGRRRFGIYKYLADVYQVYRDLRSRRVARKSTRRIEKLFKLSIQRKSHPIRILIEASAGPEDNRAKSRWTQALRYVWGWRQPAKKVKWTLEANGGISGCASKYALNKGTNRRKNSGLVDSTPQEAIQTVKYHLVK